MPDVKGGLLARKRNLAQYPSTGELRSYTPTLRERARTGLLGDTRPTAERLRFTEGLLGSSGSMGLLDVTPAGTAFALQEAARARDPQAAAMAVMPVPGARLAKSGLKTVKQSIADITKQAKAKGVDLMADADARGIVLSWVESSGANKGAGTEAVSKLNDLADKHGLQIDLTAIPGMAGYYKKLGYKSLGVKSEDGLQMHRLPAEKAAKKAIVRASKQRVPFQGAAPNRTEFSLVRFKAPKGDSERFARLEQKFDTDPVAFSNITNIASQGQKIGRKWYDTEKLRERFQSVLGAEDGDAAWKEYMWLVGATSTGAKPMKNIPTASHYFVQGQRKLRQMADDLIAGNYQPPKGYGHKMQKNQMKNVGMLMKGLWGPQADPRLNPKPRGFAQSLMGSERNMAADKHFMRLMGMSADDPAFLHTSGEISQELVDLLRKKYGKKLDPYIKRNEFTTDEGKKGVRINFNAKTAVQKGPKDLYQTIKMHPSVWADMPNANEYGAMERLTGKLARGMKMTPAQFQASLWMGAAQQTKVDPSSLDTFVNLFNRQVAMRAKQRGRTEADVFKRFATRKEALALPLGLLGAGVGGGLLSQPDQQ